MMTASTAGRRNAGALERCLDRDAAEIAGGQGREIALQAADRRPRGADDHDWVVVHLASVRLAFAPHA